MTASAPDTRISPYKSILDWSVNWPDWQRDALRRIIGTGSLTPADIAEMLHLCRAKHGLFPETGAVPTPIPLTPTDIPGGADGTSSVSLERISDLHNVASIPSDQTIDFGPSPGLTVIYGENGAGKSAYARVIKKACRARGTLQSIRPNAFAPLPTPNVPATAKIDCRVGDVDTTVAWKDGAKTDPRLSNIFVFDRISALAHVGEDGPACFKPRGLDVLPELARACDEVKKGLQTDIDAASTENTRVAEAWTYRTDTAVGKLINAIAADTKPGDINAAAVFREDDAKRLAQIKATLSADPKIKSADTAAAAKRIREFATLAKSRAISMDDTAMQNIADTIKDADTTAKAAKAAKGPKLDDRDLPGSFNPVWRKLWDAAEAFSLSDAYKGQEYPVTEAGARCVLCQQDLQPEAVERFARFNEFVRNETRKRAEDAKAKVTALIRGVELLSPISESAAGLKADLEREAPGTYTSVQAFGKAIDARISHLQKALKDSVWTEPPLLPPSPVADLDGLAVGLDARAKDELLATDPEKAKSLEAERDELHDKEWLSGKRHEVLAQVERHTLIVKLKECQRDCTTNTITLRSGELHEAHVTGAFCAAFKEELDALAMKTLPVRLDAARGAKGEQKFAVKLDATTTFKVSDVASEGEHGCIALAAFFAELSQSSHRSALVLDDPVSSLDHKRRYEIAARLVKEAKQRQVVVFTHDLAFVCDLQRATHGESMHIHYQHVEHLARIPGRILPGLPWVAKSSKEQMKTLREQVVRAEKVHRERGDSEYREVAMPVVVRLRGACERIIEEHLLNRVVRRHDSKISVRHLEAVAVVTRDQYKMVHSIWQRCSDIFDGHATSRSRPVNVPPPNEIKEWVASLEKVIEDVKTARKAGSAASH